MSSFDRLVPHSYRQTNYSDLERTDVSDSTNPLIIKTALQQRTQAVSNLLWNDLSGDTQLGLTNYDWQGDPHLNLWAMISANSHRSM